MGERGCKQDRENGTEIDLYLKETSSYLSGYFELLFSVLLAYQQFIILNKPMLLILILSEHFLFCNFLLPVARSKALTIRVAMYVTWWPSRENFHMIMHILSSNSE